MKTRTVFVGALILAAALAYLHASGRIEAPSVQCVTGAGRLALPECTTSTAAR